MDAAHYIAPKHCNVGGFGFVDNRPEAVAQRMIIQKIKVKDVRNELKQTKLIHKNNKYIMQRAVNGSREIKQLKAEIHKQWKLEGRELTNVTAWIAKSADGLDGAIALVSVYSYDKCKVGMTAFDGFLAADLLPFPNAEPTQPTAPRKQPAQEEEAVMKTKEAEETNEGLRGDDNEADQTQGEKKENEDATTGHTHLEAPVSEATEGVQEARKPKGKKGRRLDPRAIFGEGARTQQQSTEVPQRIDNRRIQELIAQPKSGNTSAVTGIKVSEETVYLYIKITLPSSDKVFIPTIQLEIHYHPVPKPPGNTNYLHVKTSAGGITGNRIRPDHWLIPQGALTDADDKWNEQHPGNRSVKPRQDA